MHAHATVIEVSFLIRLDMCSLFEFLVRYREIAHIMPWFLLSRLLKPATHRRRVLSVPVSLLNVDSEGLET